MDLSTILINNIFYIKRLSSTPFPKGMSLILSSQNVFSSPNREAFELIVYYLLKVLSPELLTAQQVPWPVVSREHQTQFKRKIYDIFTDLSKIYPDCLSDVPHNRHFNTYKGEQVLDFLFRLSFVTLRKEAPKFQSLGKFTISNREKFLERVRKGFHHSLHDMNKCADMMSEHDEKIEELQAREKETHDELEQLTAELLKYEEVGDNLTETAAYKEVLERVRELSEKMSQLSVVPPPVIEKGSVQQSLCELMVMAEDILNDSEEKALEKLGIFKSLEPRSCKNLEESLSHVSQITNDIIEGLEDLRGAFRVFCDTYPEERTPEESQTFPSPMVDFPVARGTQDHGSGFTPKVSKQRANIFLKKEKEEEMTVQELNKIIDSPSDISLKFSPVVQESHPKSRENTPRRAPRPSIDRLIQRFKRVKERAME